MNAVIYLLVAVLAGLLGVRSFMGDRHHRLHRDFAVLAGLLSITYLSFSFYLFPGIPGARFPFALAGTFLPVATLQFLEHFIARRAPDRARTLRRLWAATPVVALAFLATDLALFGSDHLARWPESVLGVLIYVGFGAALWRMWQAHQATPYRVEKTRIRYLFGFMAGSVAFSALEGLDRLVLVVPQDIAALPILQRGVELQGHLPPIGALFTGLFLFFLYQMLVLERLLDLNELFSRFVTLAGTALTLVIILGVGVLWVQAATGNQLQTTFHLFVVSLLFLLGYDPLRERIASWAGRWLNVRGHRMQTALNELDRVLPSIIDRESLGREIVERLHASGRVPALSFYAYDPDRRQVRLLDTRQGESDHVPLPAVALNPFSQGFQGHKALSRTDLTRGRRGADKSEDVDARLALLDGMNADLVVPVRSGDLTLGWLALKDEEWSDGFSEDEVHRLAATMARAATVLENIKGFEAAREQARLAALGTMSAGLAHEIRNPLAGIKGAAQYLETLDVTEEEREFLEVIRSETDRLNMVVTTFLDYARHMQLRTRLTAPEDLVVPVLKLTRAEGLQPGIHLSQDLPPSLPAVDVDADKIRQVVLNLVRNAIQALPRGGRVHLALEVGALQRSGMPALLIHVQDDGEGISQQQQEKLFIPFYTTKTGGTGLGLPICQRIVSAHGGELSVESAPGAGATFSVRLPLPVPDPPEEGPEADLEVFS
ncbi:MAG: ATP-binding protein [Myxococcota bacterium]|nr:ATP-binding protein [Myxococcota bacterium]